PLPLQHDRRRPASFTIGCRYRTSFARQADDLRSDHRGVPETHPSFECVIDQAAERYRAGAVAELRSLTHSDHEEVRCLAGKEGPSRTDDRLLRTALISWEF